MERFRTALLVAAATLAFVPTIAGAQDAPADRQQGRYRDRGQDAPRVDSGQRAGRPDRADRPAPVAAPAQPDRVAPAPVTSGDRAAQYRADRTNGVYDRRGPQGNGAAPVYAQQRDGRPGADVRGDPRRDQTGRDIGRRADGDRRNGYDGRPGNYGQSGNYGRQGDYGRQGNYGRPGNDGRYGYAGRYGNDRRANWRSDRRYDWSSYRNQHRDLFRAGRYYPPRGYRAGYRSFGVGFVLDSFLFDRNYWIDDPYSYRLPPAWGPYRWVRYYDDVLLVDINTGEVVDVIRSFFW